MALLDYNIETGEYNAEPLDFLDNDNEYMIFPNHLQFFCKEYDNSDKQNEVEEIQKYLLPVTITIDDIEYHDILGEDFL